MLSELRREQVSTRQHRRQMLREVTYIPGQRSLALCIQHVGDPHPVPDQGFSRFAKSRTHEIAEDTVCWSCLAIAVTSARSTVDAPRRCAR